MPKFFEWSTKELSKVFGVSGNAVGETTLKIRPDELIGVKLRRISGEVKGMESRIASKEFSDKFGAVEWAPVPEKDDRAWEVVGEMTEKLSNLFGSDVLVGMEACVEPKTFSFGRNSDGRDRRNFCPASGDNEDGCLAFNRPGFLEVRNERESALIQEYEMGSEPFGLFLYKARLAASSRGWLVPGALWPSSAVSGNSNPRSPSDSINFRYRVVPESVSGRSARYASGSRGPSKSLLLGALAPMRSPRASSDSLKEAVWGPNEVSVSNLPRPFCGRSDTSVPRSLRKLPLSGRWNGTCPLFSVTEWPDDVGLPMFGDCHEVSSYPPSFPLEYRPESVSINR